MEEHTVGIIGAGTMGAGIAQVAALHGWNVEMLDLDRSTVERAIESVNGRIDRLVEKGKIDLAEADRARFRLRVANGPAAFEPCELVIEAVIEDLDAKAAALAPILAVVDQKTIIATNTSSLSIAAIGERLRIADRTVGMHFFNPAPLLKLVEIIPGRGTEPAVTDRVEAIAQSWGKTTARAADLPGFIVNHVARPYYLEAFRLVEAKLARPAEIDATMRRAGFRMGPLTLTDLIGQDVNAATTRSVWARLGEPPLLAPSTLQEKLVTDGHLGRKTGEGVYRYQAGKDPTPAVKILPRRLRLSRAHRAAVEAFAANAVDEPGELRDQFVVARILAGLMVQATHAVERRVGDREAIDTALQYGTNYPMGPFAWMDRVGPDTCLALFAALNEDVDDDRFAMPASFTLTP
jgi:3-hydroxybutyryl-CoA dehydrogenase